jgi:cell division protein FtsI (penicillin-binding protein 3)
MRETRRRSSQPGASGSRPRAGDRRVAALFVLLAAMLVSIAARLVWVQTVDAEKLAAQAERQRLRELILAPRRGSILDREGESLAKTVDARTVYAVPHSIKDATGTANALAGVLGGEPGQYLTRLTRDSSFSYVARKVDIDRAAAVERLGIEGIGFLEDSRRTYPSGELACQVLGFVGVDDEGLAGLEKQYDSVLAGTPGRVLAERDPFGRPIPGGVMEAVDAVDGRSIQLTIDKDIQYEAHVELASAVRRFGAKAGSILVMDPRNGEILAMSSWPYFDPNSYGSADPKALRNRPVTDAYEPGSTVKSFTAAAAIDQRLFGPESTFELAPTLQVGDRTIHESHPRGTVTWTLTDIVTKSSNVGAVKLGIALGKERIYSYFSRFGLTEQTGVDFPGEARGATPPPTQWSQSSIGNIPFGQGMSVSVLQLARGFCAIANGGTLPTPHFLMRASDATTEPVWPTKRAVPAETAATMRRVLRAVVSDGTGAEAEVPGYDVAGKTGTSQKAKVGGGGYEAGAYVSSFAGFLPSENPGVLIIITLDEPTNGYYGGTVAAPSFSRLGRFCVAHLKLPPASSREATPTAALPPTGGGTEGQVRMGAAAGNGAVSKTGRPGFAGVESGGSGG